jgi:hypothetical protein
MHSGDLTLRGFCAQVAQACTSIDGPLIRSFRCLVTRPGALTMAYINGERKPYALPIPLFLIANVLFFAVQSWVGTNIFSTPLDAHLHNYFWSDAAQRLVSNRLIAQATTLELYTPVFNQAVAVNAKSLIALMVLPFAVLPAIVFIGRHRPFVAHLVFSLHFYTFLLLLFCVAQVVVGVNVAFGGAGLTSEQFDHGLSIVLLLVCAVYLYFATKPVYGGTNAMRSLKVIPLVVAAAGIVLGYRFALLLITLYTT